MIRNTSNRRRFSGFLRATLLALPLLLLAPAPEALADSLREVAERVARQNDAKVVSARVVERNGRRFYEIRILTRDGVVRTIRVPADERAAVASLNGAAFLSGSGIDDGNPAGVTSIRRSRE